MGGTTELARITHAGAIRYKIIKSAFDKTWIEFTCTPVIGETIDTNAKPLKIFRGKFKKCSKSSLSTVSTSQLTFYPKRGHVFLVPSTPNKHTQVVGDRLRQDIALVPPTPTSKYSFFTWFRKRKCFIERTVRWIYGITHCAWVKVLLAHWLLRHMQQHSSCSLNYYSEDRYGKRRNEECFTYFARGDCRRRRIRKHFSYPHDWIYQGAQR